MLSNTMFFPKTEGLGREVNLVGGLEHFFLHILRMSSSQLTFIFFRGVETTNQIGYFMIIISIHTHTHKALERTVRPPLDFMPPWKISFCVGAMSAATGPRPWNLKVQTLDTKGFCALSHNPGRLSPPQLGGLNTNNLRAGFSPLAR